MKYQADPKRLLYFFFITTEETSDVKAAILLIDKMLGIFPASKKKILLSNN